MAKKMYIAGALIMVVLHGGWAKAGQTVSLDSLIQEARDKNPEIQIAKRAAEAANARIWQAASLNDPMLEFRYDKMTADRMLTGDPMKTYGVSQEIPFPTKLYFRAKIASKAAKMEYENYKAKERDIVARVKSAYAELFIIDRQIEINKEAKAILEQLSKTAETRYSTAKGTQTDVLKAQVELATVDTELIMLGQKRLTAQARINILLNRDPREEWEVVPAQAPVIFHRSLDECYLLARQNNPELKAYRFAIEKGKAAYALSLNEFLPDFTVKFEQMFNKGKTSDEAWAGMVGVTIPLWFQKQAFGAKEMKSELEMIKAEYTMRENMVLFDVRDAYARVDANKKVVELFETSFLPQADETLKAALKGYESEKSDFLTVLDGERMLINFKLEHYKAILELRIALADLERTVGSSEGF